MRLQLSQQVQELVGKSDLVIITERVDDVALRIGQMVKMGFVEVLDRPIPQHGKQRGVSWGWTAVNGRRPPEGVGATSIKGMHHTLHHRTAQVREPRDGRDDRLGHRLHHLSKPQASERTRPA